MLVPCTNCGVQYDHNMGRCIACGAEYAPSPEVKREQLRGDAIEWLRARVQRNEVRERLVDEGLPEVDADSVLMDARDELRAESKQHGIQVAASGAGLLLIAAGVFVFTGGFLIATGCSALGGAMVVIGGLKSVTGWNITGHDDE